MERKIAICISTFNRPKIAAETYRHIREYQPESSKIFIIEDFSDNLSGIASYQFDERAGIPKVKNKCLELAYDWGATDIFCFDDDTYPLVMGWEKPYINSKYNHLCYTFNNTIYAHLDDCNYYHLANGCMMYFKRICLDTVGGFDERFGLGKYEHVNLSQRIYNAGLIPYYYMDVKNSNELLYCMDSDNKVIRSFDENLDKELIDKNRLHFMNNKTSKTFISFLA